MLAERNLSALRYPRSFLGLLVAAFLLVALPLIGTLLYSAWHTERLTEQSRSAVSGASAAARASRSLVSRIGSIERLALQLAVLPDAQLRADFARAHESFRQLVGRARAAAAQGGAARRVHPRHRTGAGALRLRHPAAARRAGPAHRARHGGGLVEDAYQVLAVSYFAADREVERLGASADEVHRRLIVMVLIATALALAAALALTRLIAQPIAELDSAIRQLGSADFDARRSASAVRQTCKAWASGWTGCASGSPSWRRRRTASCAICRTT